MVTGNFTATIYSRNRSLFDIQKGTLSIKASLCLTSYRWSQQASAAAYEHEESQCTAKPVDAHHLSQHGDVDGNSGAVYEAVGCAESSQLNEGGGHWAEE